MGYEKVDSIQVHFFTLLHNLCADSCICQKKVPLHQIKKQKV